MKQNVFVFGDFYINKKIVKSQIYNNKDLINIQNFFRNIGFYKFDFNDFSRYDIIVILIFKMKYLLFLLI